MPDKISVCIGGPAGTGIMTTGPTLARTFSRGGLHVFVNIEYPSLIRGGHNSAQICASTEEVFSHWEYLDLLVAFDSLSIQEHLQDLVKGANIVCDAKKCRVEQLPLVDTNIISLPLDQIAVESGGTEVMRNTVALGATIALIDYDFSHLKSAINYAFKARPKIAKQNISVAKAGYDYIHDQYPDNIKQLIQPNPGTDRMLLTGNEAIGLGALKAGVKWYSAYPMTPSTSILHYMAGHERAFDLISKQPEDEISAINMAIGASFAGVRAMTGTSGGGFALMSEGLGLAAMVETPLVIIEAQRPGPSTGLPTRHEQGDLNFIITASQGEFPRIILTPGDVEECFYETFNAHNLADRYQVPVIVLVDKFLSESYKSTEPFKTDGLKIERGQLLSNNDLEKLSEFKRFEFTESGISPRAIPSQPKGIHRVTGNEHFESGFLTEDPENRTKMMDKRIRKLETIRKDMPGPNLYGSSKTPLTLVSWGSTKGPCKEAMKYLHADGINVNVLHFVYVWPLPVDFVRTALHTTRQTLLVEQNATAQFGQLVKLETGIEFDHVLLKYNGIPSSPMKSLKRSRRSSNGKYT